MRRPAGVLLLCVTLILTTCTEIPGPYTRAPLSSIQVRARFAAQASSAPINRIVVTAREVRSNQIVGSVDRIVDPTAASWQLTLEVQLGGTTARDVAIAMELMHTDAAAAITVEYSGISVIAVTPGQQSQVADVKLYPGALAPVASVAVSPTQAALPVGTTLVLTALVRDAQGNALARTPTWTSSDTSKAGVSASGVVSGRNAGSAVITASVEGRNATSSITVYTPTATSIAKSSGDAQTGSTASALANPFVVRVADQQGNPVAGQSVQWVVTAGGGSVTPATSTTDVSGFAQTRLTLGAAGGSNTVEARATGLTGSPVVFTATAVSVAVATIAVAPASRALVSGDTATLTATARDANNNVLTNVPFVWTSSDTIVARVNAAGRVTALEAGSATITATAGGKSGTATVTVTGAGARVLTMYGGNGQSVQPGELLREAIVVFAGDFAGNPAPNVDVTFAIIDGGGTLTNIHGRTDARGLASAEWRLGSNSGVQHAQASAPGLAQSPITFEATAASVTPQRKTWIGGSANGATNWQIAANWNPIGVPGEADTVVIPATTLRPAAGGYVYAGTLIVQAGAILETGGYSVTVSGNLDVTGSIVGIGSVRMTGNNKTVRGAIAQLYIYGNVTAVGGVTTTGQLFVGEQGNLNVSGQTITVGTDFGVGGGMLTMNSPSDLVLVRGSASFANTDERGHLNAGVIRVSGDFVTGCYNDTEFISVGVLVIMDGTASPRIRMCGSATGNRFKDLTIAAGARVFTSSNPVVVERAITISGSLTVEAAGVMDVMGPAGSLIVAAGGTLVNGGVVKANLPISNGGTVTGNAVVQR